jgi:IclR family acetate operon transcriptional repressor
LLLASAAREWLGPVARPFLEELVEVSHETANLSGLEKNSIIYIDQVPSPRMVQTFIQPGNRAPVHTTGSGKVLLAHQPEDMIEAMIRRTGLLRLTPNTITDPDQLKGELDRIRRRGYATDLEETEEGIRAVAAPIFSPDGKILVAVSIAGPAGRLSQARIEELVPHIKRIAGAFSESLKSSG